MRDWTKEKENIFLNISSSATLSKLKFYGNILFSSKNVCLNTYQPSSKIYICIMFCINSRWWWTVMVTFDKKETQICFHLRISVSKHKSLFNTLEQNPDVFNHVKPNLSVAAQWPADRCEHLPSHLMEWVHMVRLPCAIGCPNTTNTPIGSSHCCWLTVSSVIVWPSTR